MAAETPIDIKCVVCMPTAAWRDDIERNRISRIHVGGNVGRRTPCQV